MKSLKDNYKLGAVLSIVGIITGLLVLFIIASIYQVNIDGKILGERPDEAISVQIVFAMLSWVGIAAGALWVTVFYGFIKKAAWAWSVGAVAATIQLLSGFFPMIPPASIGLPTPTVYIFILAGILWFGMLLIGGVDRKIIIFAFVSLCSHIH